MSGIISSYLIEPVVRQARRFSSAARPAKPQSDGLTSEVVVQEATVSDKHHGHTSTLPRTAKKQTRQETNNCGSDHNINAKSRQRESPDLDLVDEDPPCACASARQSHASTSPNILSASTSPPPNVQPASHHIRAATAINPASASPRQIQQVHQLSCPCPHTVTPAPHRQSDLAPLTSISNQTTNISSFAIIPDPVTSLATNHHQTLIRTRSLGSLFSGSVFSDRDWSACSRHNSDSPTLTDFQPQLRHLAMESSNDRRRPRPGSDATTQDASNTELARRIPRTRRFSWSDARRPRTSDRRPTLHEHYTDSIIAIPFEEPSRTKQDEDIMSRETDLRRKIQEICQLSISNEEKAKRIHYVMNERYLSKLEERQRKKSADDIIGRARPRSSDSCKSDALSADSGADIELYTRFNVTPDDLIPTRRPRRHSEDAGTANILNFAMTPMPAETNRNGNDSPPEPEFELGCEHYKRNVKIQCFECKMWCNCRYCHDQAETGHSLPRHKTENMLCMLCQTPGPAGQYCEHCGEQSAYYFCEICKLWDDDSTKRIYHCADCGICRLGEGLGKDFQHCKRCNVCIPFQQFSWHKCLERATDCDCPICGDYMFNSKAPIVSMPCGHYLHRSCYNQYMLNSYQCPICKKSARNMESQWRKMEEEIARQPMPMNLRNVSVDVRCNDCGGKSRVPYHWLGNKCGLCDTFNTTEIEIHRDGGGILTATSPSPPRGNWRTVRAVPQARRVRRYFEDDEDNPDAQPNGTALGETVAAESLLGLPNTAYELFATMTRNLSPIRRYLNNREDSDQPVAPEEGAATEGEIERMGFWSSTSDNANTSGNTEAWEDDEDDEEDSDDDESTDDEGPYMFDDDSDSSSEGGLGLDALDVELIGHR